MMIVHDKVSGSERVLVSLYGPYTQAFNEASMSDQSIDVSSSVNAETTSVSNKKIHHNAVNLVGKRFGKLLVLGPSDERRGSSICWVCRCDCGRIHLSVFTRKRPPKSCGCGKGEFVSKSRRTHGKSRTRLYHIWRGMVYRCHHQKSGKDYRHYRGRGITVCERWLSEGGFENFLSDMGDPGEGSKLSIERRNNDLGYSPDNCYWATQIQQHRNKRNNTKLELHGVVKTLSEWAELTGIKRFTIGKRLSKGWSVEKALLTPVKKRSLPDVTNSEDASHGQA